jgi:hypothetical protein
MKHKNLDHPSRGRMPRSRGTVVGLLLVLLGVYGALIPFVGPHFNFAYTPDQAWTWTTARGWLEVLPGAVTAVGGLLLIVSGHRASALFGGWLVALGGAWFVVGPAFAPVLHLGSVGDPVAYTDRKRAVLEVAYFYGVGALIVFLGGAALARVAVRLARDVRPVDTVEPAAATPAGEPYYSGLEEAPRDVSTDAITRPRVEAAPPQAKHHRRSFRRHRETAMAGYPDPQA